MKRRDTLLDVLLLVLALGLHLAACAVIEILPPSGGFETTILVLPVLADVLAIALLLVRGDLRGAQGAAVLQCLVVLYLLPDSFLGLRFAPAALCAVAAAVRPRTALSSDRSDAG